MNLKKLYTHLWAAGLAFTMSFSAVCCMVTAFKMAVDISTVTLWCGLSSVLFSLCYSVPLGLLPLSSVALISGILWQQGRLRTSIEALIYRLTRQYSQAYDWEAVKLNNLTADKMESHLWLILCLLGVVIAMLISWAVSRRKTALPGCLLAFSMLASCMVVTDTVPDIPYLYLLLLSILLLALTNTVRRQDETRGNRVSLMMALPAAVALLVLFAVVPKDAYKGTEPTRKLMDKLMNTPFMQQWVGDLKENSVVGTSVDSSMVNLKTIGFRNVSDAEMLQVLSEYSGTMYLRGRALDRYDGVSWTDSGVSTVDLYWPDAQRLQEGGEVMISTRYAHRMLYLPYYVQSRNLNEMTKGLENTAKLTQYTFSCSVLSEESDFYRIYTESDYDAQLWDMEFAKYLHLDDDVWKWAEPLAKKIIGDETVIYKQVQLIGNYVRNSATYDTNTYRMPTASDDFAKWFLEDSETGYCIHFATAATVLLQAAGIPARYVTGYMVDVDASYLCVVRAKDAHAWAEYWLPGYGWMILEATPSALPQEETPAPEQDATAPQGGGNTGTDSQVSGNPSQSRPSHRDEQQPEEKTEQTPEASASGSILLILLPLLAAAAILGLILRWQLRLRWRQANWHKGSTNRQALCRWECLTNLWQRTGTAPDTQLHALAEKAKFSQHSISQAELTLLDQAIRAELVLLRRRGFFRRLYDRIFLNLY